jgi:hypothetical protein
MPRALSISTRAAVTLVLLVAAACESRTTSRPPPAPLTNTGVAPPPRATLIAAREDGLYELTTDGRDVRRLSATPAQQPRWQVPGKRVLFLTRDTSELRSVELATMKEQLVARMRNRIECSNGLREELKLEDDDNFFVEPGRACIRLTDRNPRIAAFRLDVRVDLATGQTAEYMDYAEHINHVAHTCKLPHSKAPPCGPEPQAFPEIIAPIEHAGPPNFRASLVSPSGRWAVLRGNFTPGDTFFDQVVLYDRTTRRTFPLGGTQAVRTGAWPAPLTAEQLAADASELYELLGPTTYETPVYWLAGPDDRLVFDEALVIPGERIVYVGQLARSF